MWFACPNSAASMKTHHHHQQQQLEQGEGVEDEHELEILKAVAQAWHGHSGNPRPTTEYDVLRTDSGGHKNAPSRFRIEAIRRATQEAEAHWDFAQSLWDSYEIVTISKKLESSLALEHPMTAAAGSSRVGGKRMRESKHSLRNLFRSHSKRFDDTIA